jgi:hypothetical protein
MNNIHPSLKPMAVDIDSLSPLDGNPRVGNVDAIMSSYAEFGQVKPIVARKNDDGTATVIAGNHQLEAARALGWDKIAVVYLDADDKRAIAFALADNRTTELGYTEPELLSEMLLDISDFYPELLEDLGWDEFEIAAIESAVIVDENDTFSDEDFEESEELAQSKREYEQAISSLQTMVKTDKDGENRIVAPTDIDQNDIATRGSTIAVPGAAPKAAVQFVIVFDDADQQAVWYKFIKWLRADPGIDGSTTAEKLINFIDSHMP